MTIGQFQAHVDVDVCFAGVSDDTKLTQTEIDTFLNDKCTFFYVTRSLSSRSLRAVSGKRQQPVEVDPSTPGPRASSVEGHEAFAAKFETLPRKTVNDRDRRLMRQHGRIQRALTDAINGGIEDLYALLGFGPMGSRLLRRGPHRVAQTLIVMGILKTHHVRACARTGAGQGRRGCAASDWVSHAARVRVVHQQDVRPVRCVHDQDARSLCASLAVRP